MMGYGSGIGAGGWIVMAVFWVGLLTLIGWAVVRAFPGVGNRGDGMPRQDTPEEMLDRRFAAGELDIDTYQSMRATLASTGRRGVESR